MKKATLLFLISALVIAGCSQRSFEDREALLTYLKDPENGYLQQKEVNGVAISVMYRPTDLMVAQEVEENTTPEAIASLREKYDDYLYFNLSLSKNGKELLSSVPTDRNSFGALVNQLAFGMGENIHLYTEAKDTVAMADYIYPRMYGMSGSTSLLLVYPKDEIVWDSESLTLALEDIGINTGEVKCKFATKIIKEQPQLKFRP